MKAKTDVLAGPRSIKLFRKDERDLYKFAIRSDRSMTYFIRIWVHEKMEAVRRRNGLPKDRNPDAGN